MSSQQPQQGSGVGVGGIPQNPNLVHQNPQNIPQSSLSGLSTELQGQGSVEMLQKALDAVKMLRCNVTALFETIATGPKLESPGSSGPTTTEERERYFKSEFTVYMQKMVDNVK